MYCSMAPGFVKGHRGDVRPRQLAGYVRPQGALTQWAAPQRSIHQGRGQRGPSTKELGYDAVGNVGMGNVTWTCKPSAAKLGHRRRRQPSRHGCSTAAMRCDAMRGCSSESAAAASQQGRTWRKRGCAGCWLVVFVFLGGRWLTEWNVMEGRRLALARCQRSCLHASCKAASLGMSSMSFSTVVTAMS
jgi:hypothetical protein